MKYCSDCGSAHLEFKIPAGDNRPRHVCNSCQKVFYLNPNPICGTLPIFNGQILLCKRAIEPRAGFWTLPAGFMENGESTQEAAIRETLEEADASVTLDGLYSVIDLPDINQIHFFFAASLAEPKFAAGTESLEVALFNPADIPWSLLAFKSVEQTLRWYIDDCQQHTLSSLPLHTATLRRSSWGTDGAPIV